MSDTNHLEEEMNDLRSQISALPPEDEPHRQHLNGLVGDIERLVGSSGDLRAQEHLGENLNASMLRFEASHPRIATVLNQLAEKLGAMGI